MMYYTMIIYWCSLLLLLLNIVHTQGQVPTIDVCVIGGGPAGISSAYTAEKLGYTTAVFEKESYIGGKTKTVTIDNKRYRLGAVLHNGRKAGSISDLIDKFNIDTDPLPPFYTYDVDDTLEEIQEFDSLTSVSFVFSALWFLVLRGVLSFWLNGPEPYLTNYPHWLHQDTASYFHSRVIGVLKSSLWYTMTVFGYGELRDIAAIYVLKYSDVGGAIDGALSQILPQFSQSKILFFQDVLLAMADTLNGKIYLSTNITNVEYGGTTTTLTFIQKEQEQQQIVCNNMIIAFPQTADGMQLFTPPTIATELNALTAQVRTMKYYTILVPDPNGIFGSDERALFLETQNSIPFNPPVNMIYWKSVPAQDASVAIYYYSPVETTTDDEVLTSILSHYNIFTGQVLEKINVQDFNAWVYFPHVNKESLDSQFYKEFNKLQGESNQYYVGALFSFETVANSMAHAEHIIKKFL